MCGIIGYLGPRAAAPVLMESLRRLEYRGYDSAGIVVVSDDGIAASVKSAGKVETLVADIGPGELPGRVGMGHTRWATHGRPDHSNAHPQTDCSGRFFVIHNGIIENFAELKRELEQQGHEFRSQTDTEVLPHLIEQLYQGDLVAATREALSRLVGAYAVVVLGSTDPETLIGARLNAPLVVGMGRGEWFLSSDLTAIIPYTKTALVLGEGDMAVLSPVGPVVTAIADGSESEPKVVHVDWEVLQAEREGFPNFMLKEIHEQPAALENALRGRLLASGKVEFADGALADAQLSQVKRIQILGAGSAYLAGMVTKLALEDLAGVPTDIDFSSEWRYRDHSLGRDTLVVAISQSGETADTMAAVRLARGQGAMVVGLTNVVGSTLALEAEVVLNLHAGPEVSVVSTKTFCNQIACGLLLALRLAQVRKASAAPDQLREISSALRAVPAAQRMLLAREGPMAALGSWIANFPGVLFLGRGYAYPIALESALKLKEVSYLHAEGYAAGEMKHGPIALLDPAMPVVAFATRGRTLDKMRSNIQEAKARCSPIVVVVNDGDDSFDALADHLVRVPEVPEVVSPLVNVVAAQLLAYHVAMARGLDVDRPRNLAKSVTVE